MLFKKARTFLGFESAPRLMHHRLSSSVQSLIRRNSCAGTFLTPPIIRDRAGAIRPDFSVCVECSLSPN